MDKKTFLEEMDALLTKREQALINPNIYLNPEHVDYYTNYHKGDYSWCLSFLKENKSLLVIEKTPEKMLEVAKQNIRATQLFYGDID